MTLSDYLAAIKRGWWIILATLLVALVVAGAIVALQAGTYSASTQLFVASAVDTKNPEELYNRNLIATQRVASYVPVITGDVVAERVAEHMGEAVGASVTVTVVPTTVVMEITASSADPEQAAAVANAYAEVVPDVIDELEDVPGGAAQVRVTAIDTAEVPTSPDSLSVPAKLGAVAILALGLGLTFVVFRETLRRERSEKLRAAGGPARGQAAA